MSRRCDCVHCYRLRMRRNFCSHKKKEFKKATHIRRPTAEPNSYPVRCVDINGTSLSAMLLLQNSGSSVVANDLPLRIFWN